MNLTQIELRHLRYFLAVADAAHFTRAATKLHVTQPTLSHQIRQLEGQLNLQLFDRVGRRVKLTAAGETLLPHARKVLQELEQAQTALTELHGLKRGLLRVGIVQTVNTCVIPEIVARFSAEHAGIRVECGEMAVADIESDLEAGKLDLGVSFLPPCSEALVGQALFTEELVAVVAAGHKLAKRRRMRISELDGQPLALLAPKYCTRQLIDRAFAEAEVKPDVRVEMNSIASILSTVRRTELVSLLPSLALCSQDAGLKTIALTDPTPRRSIGLVSLSRTNCRAAGLAFAKVTQSVFVERGLGSDNVHHELGAFNNSKARTAAALRVSTPTFSKIS
jgi:LysR family cyn operon transcriptional activator